MQTVFERVSKWNAARYDQEFNLELAEKLLREEYAKEWLQHMSSYICSLDVEELEVKLLDDLADITYVAFGVCWKIGADWDDIAAAMTRTLQPVTNSLDTWTQIRPGFFIGGLIDAFVHDHELGVIDAMTMIITCCMAEATYTLQLSVSDFEAACLAVCDSNDSKSIKKVASDVKANAGDKGPYYVAPEAALKQILERRNAE